MKLSIAIADTHALPSAFVVYRGFDECIPKASKLGFHGVELALKRADEINPGQLQRLATNNNIEISCISTGQIYADGGLMLTYENKAKRENVISIFKDLIDLAEDFGRLINIGRVRGIIGNRSSEHVHDLFADTVRELCEYASPKNVTLMIEPVNRYETDFINTVEEAANLLKRVKKTNMKIMPDVFHMNIEDREIGHELAKHIEDIVYIHLADSNRLAPGNGHTDFDNIFNSLLMAGFDGWVCAEILPKPDPDSAAAQTASYLLPLIKNNNKQISFYKKDGG